MVEPYRKFVVTDHEAEVGRLMNGESGSYQHYVLVAALARRGVSISADGESAVFGLLHGGHEDLTIEILNGDLSPSRRALLDQWADAHKKRLSMLEN